MGMKKLLIITGANRGLGEAVVDKALQDNTTQIISLSRSLSIRHTEVPASQLLFLKTDLAQPFSSDIFSTIAERVDTDTVIYLLNNAGIILPIEAIGNLDEASVKTSIDVNVQYPVNLVNGLVNRFSSNKMVLANISSGAASRPILHWGMYCASKAFMKMFFTVLAEEQKENSNLKFHDINPGTMDTGMQETIREKAFPGNDYFTSLKENDGLIKPEDAALKILNEIGFYA